MKRTSLKALATVVAGVALFAGGRSLLAQAAPTGNSVVGSNHDLNHVYGINLVKNDYGDNQVCLPCHAPHQLPPQNITENLTRLWNHTMKPASSYTLYNGTSSSTSYLSTIDEVSRKCLGCHDGTIAVDSYGATPITDQTGTMASDTMGKGTAGFVVGAGGNLQHDHPIDVRYDSSSNYGSVSSSNTSGSYVYTIPWTGRNNDPSTFTINGYVSSKWGAKSYTVTALSAVSFYTSSGNTTSLTVTDANSAKATGLPSGWSDTVTNNGNGTYTHALSANAKYIYCRSCHDPHNNLYSFMRVPNDGSQLCLTCHNK